MDFVKLYNTKEYGQILVTCDTDDEDREAIQIAFNCLEDFGVCTVNMAFKEDGASQKAFDLMTEDLAVSQVAKIVNDMIGIK